MLHPAIELLMSAARRTPDAPAFVTEDSELSFSELWNLVRSIAWSLREAGVEKNQIVLSGVGTELAWPTLLALCHEATVPGYVGIGSLLTLEQAHWYVREESKRDSVAADDQLRKIHLVQNLKKYPEAPEQMHPESYDSVDDFGLLTFTSGTTGNPKAICFSIGNLLVPLPKSDWEPNGPAQTLSFIGVGTSMGFRQAMWALETGTSAFSFSARADALPDLLRDFNVEVLAGTPIQLATMLEQLTSSNTEPMQFVRAVRTGGSSPSKALLTSLQRMFPLAKLLNTFASTEAGVVSRTELNLNSDLRNLGKPFDGVEVSVVDSLSQLVPAGQVGRLRFRSKLMPLCYFPASASDAGVFHDGWFFSGDLGFIDPAGDLILAGRENEVVSLGGEKVSLTDVDSLAQNFEGVLDAATFLLQHKAGVPVLALAYRSADGFNPEGLIRALQQSFGQESPRVTIQVSEIPRNAMGKIQRNLLSAKALEHFARKKPE